MHPFLDPENIGAGSSLLLALELAAGTSSAAACFFFHHHVSRAEPAHQRSALPPSGAKQRAKQTRLEFSHTSPPAGESYSFTLK